MKIIHGEIKPGDRLFEDAIGAEFGVSRVPVREAFRVLEGQGFVQSRRYTGTVVTDPSDDEINDYFRIRCALEPLAALQATERATGEHIAEIKAANREARRALREGRIEEVATINSHFHELIAVASCNSGLFDMIRQVRFRTDRFNHIATRSRAIATIRDHVAIADAIATKNVDLAVRLSTEHAEGEVAAYRLSHTNDAHDLP